MFTGIFKAMSFGRELHVDRIIEAGDLATSGLTTEGGDASGPYCGVALTVPDAAVRAAVAVAEHFGITSTAPAVLADAANVVVHLSPAPVVAKVAASTPAVRPDSAAWLQRELDVTGFLLARGVPVVPPSPEVPATTHSGHGHVMSFWRYQPPVNPAARGRVRTRKPSGRCCATCTPCCAATRIRCPCWLRCRTSPPSWPARRPGWTPGGRRRWPRRTACLPPNWTRPLRRSRCTAADAGAGNLMATGQGWLWH